MIAITLPDNVASRRVMEKTGFVYEREIRHVGLAHVLYRRRAPGDGADKGQMAAGIGHVR